MFVIQIPTVYFFFNSRKRYFIGVGGSKTAEKCRFCGATFFVDGLRNHETNCHLKSTTSSAGDIALKVNYSILAIVTSSIVNYRGDLNTEGEFLFRKFGFGTEGGR